MFGKIQTHGSTALLGADVECPTGSLLSFLVSNENWFYVFSMSFFLRRARLMSLCFAIFAFMNGHAAHHNVLNLKVLCRNNA